MQKGAKVCDEMKYDYFCQYKGTIATDSVMSLLYSILKQKETYVKLIFNKSLNGLAYRNLGNLFQVSLKDSNYMSICVMGNMGYWALLFTIEILEKKSAGDVLEKSVSGNFANSKNREAPVRHVLEPLL